MKKVKDQKGCYYLGGDDDKGTVYDCGRYIKREIIPDYLKKSIEIYNLYKEKRLERIGIVKTTLTDQKSYIHPKHLITYPHEWTSLMFKDSILFQLLLVTKLKQIGLTLKDYLPNNVLFQHTKPVFVDFLSMVPIKDLNKEKWLYEGEINSNAKPGILLIKKMFVPYLLLPLLIFAKKDYKKSRDLLRYNACNLGKRSPDWKDFSDVKGTRNLGLLIALVRLRLLLSLIKRNYFKAIEKYISIISKIDVSSINSGYLSYYEAKGEDFSLENKISWLEKQNFVYKQLKQLKPKTVLDIGANTGWFSRLSEKMGASVISTDVDETVMNHLYKIAKNEDLKILPLLIPFSEFLITNKNEGIIPAIKRMRSDLVLCLALLHHLVLGEGFKIEIIIKTLSKLSIKACILEYIDLTDEKIRDDPNFFPQINKFNQKKYNLKMTVFFAKKYFNSTTVFPSTESTRMLLLLKDPK